MCTWLFLPTLVLAAIAHQARKPDEFMQDYGFERRDSELTTRFLLHHLLLSLTSSAAWKHASPKCCGGGSIQASALQRQLNRCVLKRSLLRYGSIPKSVPRPSVVMRVSEEENLQIILGSVAFLALTAALLEGFYPLFVKEKPEPPFNSEKPISFDDLLYDNKLLNKNAAVGRGPESPVENFDICPVVSFPDFLLWYRLRRKTFYESDFLLTPSLFGVPLLLQSFWDWGDAKASVDEVAAGPDACSVRFAGLPTKQLSVADSNKPMKIFKACGSIQDQDSENILITVRSAKSSEPLGFLSADVARLPPRPYISLPWQLDKVGTIFGDTPEQGIILSNVVYVQVISVDADARGQGVARTLMDWILRKAECWGADGVALNVEKKNVPALNLYRSFGFDTVPSWLGWEGKFITLVKWFEAE